VFEQDFAVPQVMESGPISDGKWSHHKVSSILSTEILKLYFEDSQILLASSSALLEVSWRAICGSISGSIIFPKSLFHHIDFMEKFWKSEKNAKFEFCGFQNFEKFELKNSSILFIRIIRKISLIREIRIFGQQIHSWSARNLDGKIR